MIISLENITGEEREGFYIQPIMKRAWAAELDVLKEIDQICRRHHIRYWGWYGTLLGAVRHRGFIPWDDDVDLAMLREDYERFRYFAEIELPEGWKVFRDSPALICVKNAEGIQLDQKFLDRYHGCPYSVGVDIFCMDRIPHEEEAQEMHVNLFRAVRGLHMNWECEDGSACWEGGDRWSFLREVEELTGYHMEKTGDIKKQLYDLADTIAAMYWDTEYEEVAFVPRLCDKPNEYVSITCFDKKLEMSFENRMLPVVEDYDLICRLLYGDDYMVPRKIYDHHDYPFFRNQIEELREWFKKKGESFPCFFDMIDK